MRRPRSLEMVILMPLMAYPPCLVNASLWKRKARRLCHWPRAIFSTKICSVGVAGWNSTVRSTRRALRSSGSSPATSRAVLDAKPCEKLLRQDLALPSVVLGPDDFCEFALFAAICRAVAMVGAPFLGKEAECPGGTPSL